jgi:hypothetical protein
MKEGQTDITLEIGGVATHDCPCCGRRSETVHGFLYRPDGATSVYFAGYTLGHPERHVDMLLSVGGWGEGTTPADRQSIALQAIAKDDGVTFTFPSPETTSCFDNQKRGFLGEMRSPEELSTDDRRHLTGQAEIALAQDPRVASYLAT